jgi:serine/threonine protein phosphatase 1
LRTRSFSLEVAGIRTYFSGHGECLMQFAMTMFRRRRRPSGPRGHRAYVVGDVHGRLDLLDILLALIEKDILDRGDLKTTIVFLGDLIDRGPDSAGVIERLSSFNPGYAEVACLMGNHEEVLLRVADGEVGILPQWLRFGGKDCLQSYGLDPASIGKKQQGDAAALIRETIPQSHLKFLRSFADTISFGSFLFVHAGIRPGTSLDEQLQYDLRWIREPFLSDERDHGYVVVHGHTISDSIEVRANRIGIDTGAYKTGVLTALAIEGSEFWSLQTDNSMVTVAGTRAKTWGQHSGD